MQTRRIFLGAAAAGVGSVVTGSIVLDPRANAQGRAAAPGPHGFAGDGVTRELRRQLKGAVHGVRTGKSEGARQLASVLRIAAAHGAARGVDAEVRSSLRRAVRAEGKQALLLREVPHARMAAEAREFGVDAPAHPVLDLAGRERALDQLLAEGLTPQWLRAADFFEGLAGQLDA